MEPITLTSSKLLRLPSKLPLMVRWSSPRRRKMCGGRWLDTEPLEMPCCSQRSRWSAASCSLGKRESSPSQKLAIFKRVVLWVNITPTDISRTIKDGVQFLGPSLVFTPKYVSARSLHMDGSMALFCSGVDTNIIKLVSCWRSDKILRYLHVQVDPLMRKFANSVVQSGSY